MLLTVDRSMYTKMQQRVPVVDAAASDMVPDAYWYVLLFGLAFVYVCMFLFGLAFVSFFI